MRRIPHVVAIRPVVAASRAIWFFGAGGFAGFIAIVGEGTIGARLMVVGVGIALKTVGLIASLQSLILVRGDEVRSALGVRWHRIRSPADVVIERKGTRGWAVLTFARAGRRARLATIVGPIWFGSCDRWDAAYERARSRILELAGFKGMSDEQGTAP